ncbi:hypothetical protein ACF0H5_023671 [Mactra antiquata]
MSEKSKNETKDKKMESLVPYTCLFVDAEFSDFRHALTKCLSFGLDRKKIIEDIENIWKNEKNKNHVLPCLSVRSGLDLYLKVMNFPPGSEVIMSAINIPDMVHVVRHHNLKVVPLDISIETTEPKVELLPHLVTDKTVAILIAHIYGKWCDMDPIIEAAQQYNLIVIEDCAESFCGYHRLGDPRSDVALFSFGVIKYCTSFGGAIVKIRDQLLYDKMMQTYNQYPTQKSSEYLTKICKYMFFFGSLEMSTGIMYICRSLNIDYKSFFLKLLRGFPKDMLRRIKHKPSTPLLSTMKRRFENFKQSEFENAQVKGEYARQRLPENAQLIGMKAKINNYWLFPILVDTPDEILHWLNAVGVEAYRGATQLNIIEPENDVNTDDISQLHPCYPAEARYLIDHVIYLPIHKNVPFHELNKICKAVHYALKMSKDSPRVRLQSKL